MDVAGLFLLFVIVLSVVLYARKAPYHDRIQPAVVNLKKWLSETPSYSSENNPFGFEIIFENSEHQVIRQNDEGFHVENEGIHFHLFLISRTTKDVLLCDASSVTDNLELQRQAEGMIRIWKKDFKK